MFSHSFRTLKHNITNVSSQGFGQGWLIQEKPRTEFDFVENNLILSITKAVVVIVWSALKTVQIQRNGGNIIRSFY